MKSERYNSFEYFGYDIMIDTNYQAWLLEVNDNPGLAGPATV